MNKTFILLFLLALTFSLTSYNEYFKFGVSGNPFGDTLAYPFPIRFLISSAIRQGIFPLWDQWTMGGMSLSTGIASILSPFSPIVLFFSIFGVYSLQTLKVEMFLMQALCFLGMFLWIRDYTNKWIAIFGAFVFSLSSIILGTINAYIALVSMSLIPLVSYSIRRIFLGSIPHIGILSLSLYLLFTTGYLGINMVLLTIVPLFCLLEFCFVHNNFQSVNELSREVIKKVGLLFLSVVLFLGITNFIWIESFYYTGFNYSIFRPADFDSNYGSTRISSLVTTIFPNLLTLYTTYFNEKSPISIPREDLLPGFDRIGTIYFGMVSLIFIFYAFFSKRNLKLSLLLGFFIILSFLLSLSKEYFTTTFLSLIYPPLNLTRSHVWFNSLTIFFAVTLSCIGIYQMLQTKDLNSLKKILIRLTQGLLVVCLLIIIFFIPLNSFIYLPQLITLLAILGALWFIKKKRDLILSVVLIACIEIFFHSGNYMIYLYFWDYEAKTTPALVQTHTLYSKESFPKVENMRKPSLYNTQMTTKIPSYEGYINVLNPKILNLQKKLSSGDFKNVLENVFYFSDKSGNSLKVEESLIQIEKFEPNKVEVLINNPKDDQVFVWSSPFSQFWKASINGVEVSTRENKYGLTEVSLAKGKSDLVFQYKPPYLLFCILIMAISLSLSIMLATFGFKKKQNYV